MDRELKRVGEIRLLSKVNYHIPTLTDEQDADMKGIKAPARKLQTMSSSDIRWQGADGKHHIRLQETPGEKKRPREVISLDSVEGSPPSGSTNVR